MFESLKTEFYTNSACFDEFLQCSVKKSDFSYIRTRKTCNLDFSIIPSSKFKSGSVTIDFRIQLF